MAHPKKHVLRSSDRSVLESFSTDGWTNEKKRIGSPPLLDLPLLSILFPPTHPARQIFANVRPQIRSILARHRIVCSAESDPFEEEESPIQLVTRCASGEHDGYWCVHVMAEARDEYASNWAKAVNDVRILLRNRDLTK